MVRPAGIAYTRYCDDLTFSGDVGLAGAYRYAEARLRGRVFGEQEKDPVSGRWPASMRHRAGGHEKVDVPAEYRRALRQELYYCKKFGLEEHLRSVGWEGGPDGVCPPSAGAFQLCAAGPPGGQSSAGGGGTGWWRN